MNYQKKNNFKDTLELLIKDWRLYVLVLPMVIWYILFLYRPMYGLQIAFKDFSLFKGIAGSPWVGLDNFREFMAGPYFFRTIRNTLLISIYTLLIGFPIPIILALMFNELRMGLYRRIVQTLTYLPHFISVVIVAGIIVNFLSPTTGIVNHLLEKLGLERIYFLIKPEWFRPVYIFGNIWKEAGFSSIVYLAALSGINPELYEAASIDGANRFKQIWHITIPGMFPTIVIMLVIRIGRLLEVGYEKIILLYQPATYETADVLSTYIYRAGIQSANYSLATAAGLFNAVIAFILVFFANRVSRKLTETSLW